MKHKIHSLIIRGFYMVFKVIPINKKKVSFINIHSYKWNGNLKILYETIGVEKPKYKRVKLTIRGSQKKWDRRIQEIICIYQIATSKYVIVNDYLYLLEFLKIRNDVELIQVWHAAGAFKKFGKDSLQNMKSEKEMKKVEKVHGQYTKVIVSAQEVIPIYAKAFGIPENRVYATGLPRTDILYFPRLREQIQEQFYSKYKELRGKKILLYAPTYRDGDRENFELKLNIDKLLNGLTSDYVIVLKMHPFITTMTIMDKKYQSQVLNLSNEEINTLMIVSHMLITDYSSIIFEYAIMEKPIIFYAYDLIEYQEELRGFYYEYKRFIPGPVVSTTEEIVECIKNNVFNYSMLKEFGVKFNDFGDGHSTNRVIKLIFEEAGAKNNG